MATIEYLWHDHLLHLTSVLTDAEARCFVCLQSVSGYNYRCPKCSFFLHISCLKLPSESLHPLHQKHPLILLPQPPHDDYNQEVICNGCKNPCSGFTYHCATCTFTLHLQCASKRLTFKPEIHKHSLTFSVSPPNGDLSFRCKVCGDLGHNFNLYCQGCQFVVHIECSALPLTVKRAQDEHPFILVPTRSVDEEPEEVYCDVCEELVNPDGCIYYCEERVYIAHLGCLTSARKPLVKLSYKEVDPSSVENSDQLNLKTDPSGSGIDTRFEFQSGLIDDDELTKLRRRFREQQIRDKAQSSQASEELQVQLAEPTNVNCNVAELQHFSHHHPLILNNDHEKEKANCPVCWEQISGAHYGCAQCKYFLHRWCAELPQKIQHPIHSEHTLTLLSRAPPNTYECKACDEPCDAFSFTYHCNSCYFKFHAICASIPSTLVNEIHQHPLALSRKRPYSTSCKACGNDCTGTVFECDMCNLVLDFKCGLLPHKVRHRRHRHPLTLSPLVEYDSDEYYCDICEKRGDPNYWVYCCLDCEYIAHMNCVVSELIGGPPSTGLLQYDHHEHLLNLITKSPFKSS